MSRPTPRAALCGHCSKRLNICDRTGPCFAAPVRYWLPEHERHETIDEARARVPSVFATTVQRGPDAELDTLRAILRELEPLSAGGRSRVLLYVALQTSPHALPFDALVDLLRAGQQP